MKTTKTLIALGVSCTLGVGAAVAASTPFPVSVDDATPWISHEQRISSMITYASHDTGSTSISAGGSVGGTVSSLSGDEMQLSSTTADDDTLALADEDIDTLAFADEDSDTLAFADEGGLSADEMQLSSATADDDTLALADEGIYSEFYRVSVVPVTVEEWDYYVLSPVASDDFIISAVDSQDFYVLSPVSYDVVAFYDTGLDDSSPAM